MEIKITDYLPEITEIPQELLSDVRDRLLAYLKSNPEFQDIDCRPNSVVGDLILSPLAHLVASLEVGLDRVTSDIDLSNVSGGTIYNCEFVKKYLDNFGQGQVYEYPSTGVVQLTYADPKSKILDFGTKFMFAGDGGSNYIYELVGVTNNLKIKSPYEPVNLNDPDERRLVKVSEDRYVLNLAVQGPAGVGVNANTDAATDIPHSSLVSAKALGDFDRGTLPENVMELASKVQKTYYSSSLNNRSGATSFVMQAFPEVRGVSPVINGDSEMTRDKANILGVKTGAMDLYVKSRDRYIVTEQELKMVFDNETDTWVGATEAVEPILWVDNIKRVGASEDSVIKNIFGKSLDTVLCPDLSAAYSKYEKLGFEISEGVTADDITPENQVNGNLNEVVLSNDVKVSLVGQYRGDKFLNEYERNLTLQFTDVFTDPEDGQQKLKAVIRDDRYSDIVRELTLSQNSDNATEALVENPEDLESMLSGIDISIRNQSGTFSEKMSVLSGVSVRLRIIGRGGLFTVKYRYDPNYSLIDKTVSGSDVQPVNTSVITKNFTTCYVNNINIDYRKKSGKNVDLVRAKEEILNYVNRLAHPYAYEEYTVAEILLFYGAEGVQKITQEGQFFRSIANNYLIEEDGEYVSTEIENPKTESLLSPGDYDGIGPRNINYILDGNNITFNAILV